MASSRHTPGGTSGRSSRTKSPLDTFYLCALDTYNAEVGKDDEQNIHGGLVKIKDNFPLSDVAPFGVTAGIGKLMFVINVSGYSYGAHG